MTTKIEWPNLPREQLGKVDDETVKTDPLYSGCCKVEKRGEDTVITIKLEAEVHLPPGLLTRNSGLGTEGLAAELMNRYLFDLNMDVLPAIEYHLEKAGVP